MCVSCCLLVTVLLGRGPLKRSCWQRRGRGGQGRKEAAGRRGALHRQVTSKNPPVRCGKRGPGCSAAGEQGRPREPPGGGRQAATDLRCLHLPAAPGPGGEQAQGSPGEQAQGPGAAALSGSREAEPLCSLCTFPLPAGLWLYLAGSGLPCLTLIGSPNFGYRSVHRDLEAQIAIVTESQALQQQLHQVGLQVGFPQGGGCWCLEGTEQ